jgi:hypothetical protein
MMHTHVGLPAAAPTDAAARCREWIEPDQKRLEFRDREDFHSFARTSD